MSAISTTASTFGKTPRDRAGEHFPQRGEISRSVAKAINQLFGDAAARVLGDWFQIDTKQANRKLDCERAFDLDELGALIRSERGFEIVVAIMGDANPKWWRVCSALMDAADVRAMQIVAQRRIAKTLREAIDADADLTAAIARSEALAFHDEDHMRPHLDALRSMARLSDRTVAPAKTKRE